MKLNAKQGKETLERIKKSLQKEVALSAKNGLDVKKFWADLQKTSKIKA